MNTRFLLAGVMTAIAGAAMVIFCSEPVAAPAGGGENSSIAKSERPAGTASSKGRLFSAAPAAEATLEALTARDAPGTAREVLRIEDEELRKQALLRVMQEWAFHDARGALAWAKDAAFANSYERHVASSMVCTVVARTDPEEALCLAVDYDLDREDFGLLEGLTASWARSDLGSAREWVLRQPAGALRDHLVESVAEEIFAEKPWEATEFVQGHIVNEENRRKALLTLVTQLALQDAPRAQLWVAEFPEGELRQQALARVAGLTEQKSWAAGGR